jgi:hypothetical protein
VTVNKVISIVKQLRNTVVIKLWSCRFYPKV